MFGPEASWDEAAQLTATIAQSSQGSGRTVAVAESLTSGSLASCLGAGRASSEWFAGGVVAYAEEVTFSMLGVDRGPVVTESCARQMADGVARLTAADVTLGVTGAGGPDPQDGAPAGTVFIAVRSEGTCHVEEYHLDGGPPEVIRETTLVALRLLAAAVGSDA